MDQQGEVNSGAIVTPEGVVLDFWIAGLGSRALAFAIDFLVRGLLFGATALAAAGVGFASSVAGIIILLVGMLLSLIGYPVAFESLNGGRTLGHMVVGSRVVTIEGGAVRFRHSLIRALLAIVDLFISAGAVGVLFALLTKRGQRLGDLVAGTMVVRERAVGLSTASQHFQATMDTSAMNTHGVSAELYQTMRDFLGRRWGMTPAARAQVAGRLQDIVVPAVGVTPGPGTNPELFLTSVVAAVQVRDGLAPASAAVASEAYPTSMPPPPFGQVGRGGPQVAPPPPVAATPHSPAPPAPAPRLPPPLPVTPPSAPLTPPPPPDDGGFAAPR